MMAQKRKASVSKETFDEFLAEQGTLMRVRITLLRS